MDEIKEFKHIVGPEDFAVFQGKVVHEVYATFALARDAEWVGRLFIIDLCQPDEEGVGTHVHIEHKNPAFVGEEVIFAARIEKREGNAVICSFEASVGNRVIATGTTGQKILKRKKIEILFSKK